MDRSQPAEREPRAVAGSGRLESFSDAVFAIAITLLALDLKVPSVVPANPAALTGALLGRWPSYVTFALSFASILIMWIYHHRLFQSVRSAETALLFSNGLLLLLVTIVPFPTALVGAYLTTPAASIVCAVYAGFFAVIALTYNLLWWVVVRQQPGHRSRSVRHSRSRTIALLGVPCYLVALAAAFWIPALTLIICGVLWIVWAVTAPAPRSSDHAMSARASPPTRPPRRPQART